MERISQRAVAQKLGLGRPYLSEMLAGKRRPSPQAAIRLERVTGIDIRVWLYGKRREIRSQLERFLGQKINFGRGRIAAQRKGKA